MTERFYTLTTDKNGHAESKELPICTYNEDGNYLARRYPLYSS